MFKNDMHGKSVCRNLVREFCAVFRKKDSGIRLDRINTQIVAQLGLKPCSSSHNFVYIYIHPDRATSRNGHHNLKPNSHFITVFELHVGYWRQTKWRHFHNVNCATNSESVTLLMPQNCRQFQYLTYRVFIARVLTVIKTTGYKMKVITKVTKQKFS